MQYARKPFCFHLEKWHQKKPVTYLSYKHKIYLKKLLIYKKYDGFCFKAAAASIRQLCFFSAFMSKHSKSHINPN